MTCKDCYHSEACVGFSPSDTDKDVWDLCAKGKSDEIPDIEDRCSEFKNKADVIDKKHGQWEQKPSRLGSNYKMFGCSLCGWTFTFKPDYSFCPRCGAYMKGGVEK